MNPRAAWSQEEVETARRMMVERRTAAEIAAVLGRTRNAVIGASHRYPRLMEVGLKPDHVAAPKPRRRTEKLITELTSTCCQWPLWGHNEKPDPTTSLYCGKPVVRGSYCAHHAAMAYQTKVG